MSGPRKLHSLLRRLHIGRGDVVFLHTSFRRMAYLDLTPQQFLEALIDYLGPDGTLAMPRYAWNMDKASRPWKGYRMYFERRPPFDVIHTPANIGVVPETFRLMPAGRQSLSYFWPITCLGKYAEEVTVGQEKVLHPYGADSSFALLQGIGAKILGLGVTLHTTSLALLVDFSLGCEHPHQVFTDEPQRGTILDWEGERRETLSYWMLPEVVRLIRPGKVFEDCGKGMSELRRSDEGSIIQFAYPFEIYFQEALRLGRRAIHDQAPVPWLLDYPVRSGKHVDHSSRS